MNEILSLNACSCHVLDPTKFPILVWMRDGHILVKIANQRFIGLTRTDKKGEKYWKCKDLGEAQPNLAQEQVNNSQLKKENDPNSESNSAEINNNS